MIGDRARLFARGGSGSATRQTSSNPSPIQSSRSTRSSVAETSKRCIGLVFVGLSPANTACLRLFIVHFRIIKASRCEQLEKLLLETVYYRLRIYRARARIDINRAKAAMAEHREVAAALLARDPDGTERAMRHHIRTSRQNLISRLNLKRPKTSAG
jgi:FCD domain